MGSYRSTEQARAEVFEYIEVFYNRTRRHSTLGSRSPMQFMQDWVTTQHQANRRHKSYRLEGEKQKEPQSQQVLG